jgi:hypothetical protein
VERGNAPVYKYVHLGLAGIFSACIELMNILTTHVTTTNHHPPTQKGVDTPPQLFLDIFSTPKVGSSTRFCVWVKDFLFSPIRSKGKRGKYDATKLSCYIISCDNWNRKRTASSESLKGAHRGGDWRHTKRRFFLFLFAAEMFFK